jgi:hypothetical protein
LEFGGADIFSVRIRRGIVEISASYLWIAGECGLAAENLSFGWPKEPPRPGLATHL